MSLWHTIRGRETMEHFPCVPEGVDVGMNAIDYFCSLDETPECKIADLCPLRPIYEEYQALRSVVEAETGHYSPAYRAEHWHIKAKMAATPEAETMCNDNAKAWEAIT